jgi:hypothetical protein
MRSTTAMFLALSSLVCGQFQAEIGPPVAPIGCPFVIAVSNDTAISQWLAPCFQIKDSTGALVAPGGCAGVVWPVNPGETFVMAWPQIDASGAPLAPGTYTVEINLLGVLNSTQVTIGGADAAIALLGVPRIGKNRNLLFCAPLDGGYSYLAGAALSSSGILTCAGVVPLALDPLLTYSIDPANSVFLNFAGILDTTGTSIAPSLALPNIPAIIGASFVVDFVAIDASVCPVRRIAAPRVITIG